MIPEYDKAYVFLSGGISPACSEDMEDFYLRLGQLLNVSRGIPEKNVYIDFVITETRLRSWIILIECAVHVLFQGVVSFVL